MFEWMLRRMASERVYGEHFIHAYMDLQGANRMNIRLGEKDYAFNPRDPKNMFGPNMNVTYLRFSGGKLHAWAVKIPRKRRKFRVRGDQKAR